MSSRHRRRHFESEGEEPESDGELNLVPYLDIITTLVIFLIFTFQVVIEFRLINLLPPAYSDQANKSASDKPAVTLTLFIHKEGYKLLTNQDQVAPVNIPLKGAEYDNEKLGEELDRVKRELSMGESLIMTASNEIEYSVVVAAMDASREYKDRLLFPDVLLAKANPGGGG